MKHFRKLRAVAVTLATTATVALAMAAAPTWESEPGVRKLLIEPDVSAAGGVQLASGLANRWSDLQDKAVSEGTVRVIVTLRVPFAPEGKLGPQIAAAQRSEIATAQRAVERIMPRRDRAKVHSYETIPFMAMELDADQLDAVLSSPEVVDVREDIAVKPALAESVPFIRANENWSSGYTGTGKAVVVIDTGVQKDHPFLAGRVVAEACYSTQDPANSITSYCPGGADTSTASGSAANCGVYESCIHGTHVAGISSGLGNSFSGVAKGSSIIAIQTFHYDNKIDPVSQEVYGTRASYANILKSLERAYALRNSYSIASVNMSLGGGAYDSQQTCDTEWSGVKAVIDQLRSVGIATVISSGNSNLTAAIGGPGCISTAVAVGATLNSSNYVDTNYSNSSSLLDLLAPGSSINSSIPTNTYGSFYGTSMAAPHVAGCWAILKQAKPTATVTEVLSALQTSGVPITDGRNGITRARIDCKAAQDLLIGSASYTLSVSVSGAGSGLVSSADSSINCGASNSSCAASYSSGTNVVLTASPSTGSVFTGWGGACAGTSSTCTVAMGSAKSVSASFAPVNTQTIVLGSNLGSTTAGTWLRYTFVLPPNASNLKVASSGGTGDVDLYVRFNAAPDRSLFDCSSEFIGNNDECVFASPTAGTYHVGLYAYSPYSGVTLTVTYDLPQGGSSRRYGDHNGDGKGDVLLGRASDGSVAAWIMNGGTYTSAGVLGIAAGWRLVSSGDFNGDGKADVAFQHVTDGRVAVWLMNGFSRIAAGVPGAALGWRLIGAGDFNGDGKDDLLLQHASDGRVAVWMMNGLAYTSAAVVGTASGWTVMNSGDFNGDGKADILFHRPADGAVAVWLMNGLTRTSAAIVNTAPGWKPILTGHFNSDNKSDILLQHTDGRVAVWMMNGLSYLSGSSIALASSWQVVAIRDFNGDGKADLLWNFPASGSKLVWLMNGASLMQSGSQISAAGWVPVH